MLSLQSQEVLCPGQMLRKHPVGKLMGAEDDHLVRQ